MSKETILILDQEPHIQWTLKTLLESEGYISITANSPEEAIHLFNEFEVAGFITEYCIDHFCTLEIIRDLKEKFPEVYVMMLTNNDVSVNQYREIINAGVDDYFQKPTSSERILLHLKKGLRDREVLIQKNRLEQESDRIKRKWHFPFATVAKERRLVR